MAISTQDRRFLLLCEEVRQHSHDPVRKVGAVIASGDGEVLASGTNAPPTVLGLTPTVSHEEVSKDPNWKYFVLEHAERNAIFDALVRGTSLNGATLYSTLFPCADCARAMVATGVSRLVVFGLDQDSSRDQKWLAHYRHAQHIFELAGVDVQTVSSEELSADDAGSSEPKGQP